MNCLLATSRVTCSLPETIIEWRDKTKHLIFKSEWNMRERERQTHSERHQEIERESVGSEREASTEVSCT